MSRHEGVSCDQCLKSNFRGKRYKCLICYDYDLCATCYEAGTTTTRHTSEHPMQCILTRTDFDLYYGGEALSLEQPQSFSCPFCGKMGYTETTLHEHTTAEHSDSSIEVVCPICASLPGGDPNLVTDDFAGHLTLEHRAPRDLDEPMGGFRHVRRIQHPGRGVGGTRTRRTNMHFQSAGGALSGLSPSSRETMDPIAELLSQLSSVRNRAAAAQSVSSQLQQLEMQLQTTRQQLERLPARRQTETSRGGTSTASATQPSGLDLVMTSSSTASNASGTGSGHSQFLLARLGEQETTEIEKQKCEIERADRSIFVQELLLSSLAEGLRLDDSDTEDCGSLDGDHAFPPLIDSDVGVGSSANGAAVAPGATGSPGAGDGGSASSSTCTEGNCASSSMNKSTKNSNHAAGQGATGQALGRTDVIGNSSPPPREMLRAPLGGDSCVEPAAHAVAASAHNVVKPTSRGRDSRERETNKVYKEPSSAKVAH